MIKLKKKELQPTLFGADDYHDFQFIADVLNRLFHDVVYHELGFNEEQMAYDGVFYTSYLKPKSFKKWQSGQRV
jgi:hypothetical protein